MSTDSNKDQLCIDAVKAALKAIGRTDLISALDAPPVPPSPWVEIPAGRFLYGAEKETRTIDHSYHIGRTAVTEAEWALYLVNTGQSVPSGFAQSQLPVVNVSFWDAKAYCAWLTVYWHTTPNARPAHWTPGMEVRLPTEEEWEKAARGTDGRVYPWGDVWDKSKCAANGKREPVGSYPQGASPYGVLDMSGNVWEWVDAEY